MAVGKDTFPIVRSYISSRGSNRSFLVDSCSSCVAYASLGLTNESRRSCRDLQPTRWQSKAEVKIREHPHGFHSASQEQGFLLSWTISSLHIWRQNCALLRERTAEAVGLAASLASLIEISGRVIAASYGYIAKVVNPLSRIRMVLSEVSSLNLVLGRLEENPTTVSTPTSTSVLYARSLNGVFEDCSNIVRQIDSTVQICMAEGEVHSSKHDVKAFLETSHLAHETFVE